MITTTRRWFLVNRLNRLTKVTLRNGYNVSQTKDIVAQVQRMSDDASKNLSGMSVLVFYLNGVPTQTVVGVEPTLWKSWTNGTYPRELKSLTEIRSNIHKDLAFTPSGKKNVVNHKLGAHLFLYVKSKRMDVCFELAKKFIFALGNNVETSTQTNGFKYMDGRDLTGLVL